MEGDFIICYVIFIVTCKCETECLVQIAHFVNYMTVYMHNLVDPLLQTTCILINAH